MYEAFEKLCNERGVKPYTVSQATGISTATLSNWKKGRYTPKHNKLKAIADYFGVPETYFEAQETISKISDGLQALSNSSSSDDTVYYFNKETAEMAQKLFENDKLRVLFDAAQDASPEDLQIAYDMLLALKSKENKKDG